MSRPGWAGPSLCGTRTRANRPAARRALPPRPTARTMRRRRQARGGAVVATTYALGAGLGEPGACVEAGRCQAGPGCIRGNTVPTPRSTFRLKRASASLLLSPFPDAQHPPPRLCYGERRGPISAPLDLRLPLLTSSDRQRRRLEGRGLDWAKAGNWGTRDTASVVRRSRRAVKASPRLDRVAPDMPAGRASRGRSTEHPHLRDLGGRPPAAFTYDPQRSPGSRDLRRAGPPLLKAAAPAAVEIGPGAPPPSGCGLDRSREGRYRAPGPSWPFKPRPCGRGRPPGWSGWQVPSL